MLSDIPIGSIRHRQWHLYDNANVSKSGTPRNKLKIIIEIQFCKALNNIKTSLFDKLDVLQVFYFCHKLNNSILGVSWQPIDVSLPLFSSTSFQEYYSIVHHARIQSYLFVHLTKLTSTSRLKKYILKT